VIRAGRPDCNVTPFAARYGLWASVVRKPLKGAYGAQPFGTSESVDAHVALKSYTIRAARELFPEERSGRSAKKCVLTMVGGRIACRAAGPAVTVQ
jgi:predicted amidohydrolase YtcJ